MNEFEPQKHEERRNISLCEPSLSYCLRGSK